MPVKIDQWRAGIGRFYNRLVIPKTKKKLSDPVIIFKYIFTFFYDIFLSILILKTGDFELYLDPIKTLIHIFLVVIGMLIVYSQTIILKL